MAADRIEDMLDSLANTAGVLGVVVCDHNGIPIRDTFADLDRTQAVQYASAAADMARDAAPVAAMHGGLEALRVRTTSLEFIIKANEKYLLVVIQDSQVGG